MSNPIKYPKLHNGPHPVGEAKVRFMQTLDAPYLSASGNGWLARKSGDFSSVSFEQNNSQPEEIDPPSLWLIHSTWPDVEVKISTHPFKEFKTVYRDNFLLRNDYLESGLATKRPAGNGTFMLPEGDVTSVSHALGFNRTAYRHHKDSVLRADQCFKVIPSGKGWVWVRRIVSAATYSRLPESLEDGYVSFSPVEDSNAYSVVWSISRFFPKTGEFSDEVTFSADARSNSKFGAASVVGDTCYVVTAGKEYVGERVLGPHAKIIGNSSFKSDVGVPLYQVVANVVSYSENGGISHRRVVIGEPSPNITNWVICEQLSPTRVLICYWPHSAEWGAWENALEPPNTYLRAGGVISGMLPWKSYIIDLAHDCAVREVPGIAQAYPDFRQTVTGHAVIQSGALYILYSGSVNPWCCLQQVVPLSARRVLVVAHYTPGQKEPSPDFSADYTEKVLVSVVDVESGEAEVVEDITERQLSSPPNVAKTQDDLRKYLPHHSPDNESWGLTLADPAKFYCFGEGAFIRISCVTGEAWIYTDYGKTVLTSSYPWGPPTFIGHYTQKSPNSFTTYAFMRPDPYESTLFDYQFSTSYTSIRTFGPNQTRKLRRGKGLRSATKTRTFGLRSHSGFQLFSLSASDNFDRTTVGYGCGDDFVKLYWVGTTSRPATCDPCMPFRCDNNFPAPDWFKDGLENI